jgi:hypothetical protein
MMTRAIGRGRLDLLVLACAGLFASSCASVSGVCRGEGGPVPDWSLRPNRCKTSDPSPAWGGAGIVGVPEGVADLYYAGKNPGDTEVVVNSDSAVILVRIPGKGQMVALHHTDCAVFAISAGYTGYTVNDEAGFTGRAQFDCTRPEIGHVTGDLSFTCF